MSRYPSLVLASLAATMLAACAEAPVPLDRPMIVPEEAMRPCERASSAPPRRLGPAEIDRYWRADIDHLKACADRHDALAAAIARRQ